MINDLRDHLDALQAAGDLVVVSAPVSPELEAAAVVRYCCEHRAPAPLLANPVCDLEGARLLGGPAALSSRPDAPLARVALSLGLDPGTGGREIVEALAAVRSRAPVAPVVVPTGPCKENVVAAEDVDLDRWPIPLIHPGDGGPYVNTWGTIVARTPDGAWTNWSISRVQKLGRTTMTGLFVPGQHLTRIWRMWAERGEPMPFALFQGGPPAAPFVSGMPLGDYVDEVAYLGALHGEPVELVRCETVDLEVPASAEIVFEGHVSVDRRVEEGPFGEFPGYASSGTGTQPVYTLTAITHRDDPVLPFVAEGKPVDEYHTVAGVCFSAEALGLLRDAGLPVGSVWIPFETANHWMVVTVDRDRRSAFPDRAALCRRVGEVVWRTKFGFTVPKIYLLDDDVDPTDVDELLWAVGTRQHPVRAITDDGPVLRLLACYTPEERAAGHADRAVYDCLLPDPRPTVLSFEDLYPPTVRARATAVLDGLLPRPAGDRPG
ncbi:UbiD family decarboxylase [Actinosynnema sp. NPDC050436]|uniref:UbiD family decarboxylase n=1 Tax=Actinosynnema sp. NPDC050436 TaxID=3155659 RepID=UPI0033D5137C